MKGNYLYLGYIFIILVINLNDTTEFHITSEVVEIKGTPTVIEECRPILTMQEKKKIKKEIGEKLYNIFIKYQDKTNGKE